MAGISNYKGWLIHAYFDNYIILSNGWSDSPTGTLKEVIGHIGFHGYFNEQTRISNNKINVGL